MRIISLEVPLTSSRVLDIIAEEKTKLHTFIAQIDVSMSMSIRFNVQAVIAHACHGHPLQLPTGLSV